MANTVKVAFKKDFNYDVEVSHIPNPRIEDEEHDMKIKNTKFKKLIGNKFEVKIKDAIKQICNDVFPYIKK